jgi:hypothetical protein
MFRTVFTPTETDNTIPFDIPQEWYGRNVELIVFLLDTTNPPLQKSAKQTTTKDKLKIMPPKYTFATKNFKFNRDEANKYE